MSLIWAVVALASLAPAQEPAEAPTPAQTPPQTADTPTVSQPTQDADLAAEVQQLQAEVDQLKAQLAHLNSVVEQMQAERPEPQRVAATTRTKRTPAAITKKAPAPSATPITAEGDEKTPLTVLVFQDGHRTEARNYAIVGQTLWIYTEDDSKKVPLSELDVTATKNANSDRGIVFQIPPTR
jgi:TolA-binding protein